MWTLGTHVSWHQAASRRDCHRQRELTLYLTWRKKVKKQGLLLNNRRWRWWCFACFQSPLWQPPNSGTRCPGSCCSPRNLGESPGPGVALFPHGRSEVCFTCISTASPPLSLQAELHRCKVSDVEAWSGLHWQRKPLPPSRRWGCRACRWGNATLSRYSKSVHAMGSLAGETRGTKWLISPPLLPFLSTAERYKQGYIYTRAELRWRFMRIFI